MESKELKLVVPPRTIIGIVLTLLGLWVLYLVRDIVVLFVVAAAIVVTFSPIIKVLQRYMPRPLAIILLYLLLVGAVVLIAALLLPPLFSQLSDFLGYLETTLLTSGSNQELIRQAQDNLNLVLHGRGLDAVAQLISQFQGSLGAVFSQTVNFIGGLVAFVTVFIVSFYLLNEEKNFAQFISSLLPDAGSQRVDHIMDRLGNKMSNWLLGQLALMVIVGLITTVALAILGVPYALLLGLWAGVMELLPFIGPILGAIPGVVLAFATLGWVKGIIAIAIYLLIQQVENQFLVPKIMGKALGLSPVVIIFALLVGAKLLGFIGVLIAVPIAAALSVVYEEWRKTN